MKKSRFFIVSVVVLLLAVIGVSAAFAAPAVSPAEKVYWCHVTPSGNENQLHISMNALINAGHVSAAGNPLHAGDYPGLCEDPSPPVCEDPSALNYQEEGECEYPPPPEICEDPDALNTGKEGECEYPPCDSDECQPPPCDGDCPPPPPCLTHDCPPPPVIPTPDPDPKTFLNVLGMGCASCPGANLGVCVVSSGSTSYVVFNASSPYNVTVSVNGVLVPVVNVYMFNHSPYRELAEAEGYSSGPNTYIGEFTQFWAYDGGVETLRFVISDRYGSLLDPVRGDICPPLTCNP